MQIFFSAFIYEVTTTTGSDPGQGTNCQIVLVLYGVKGQTEPLLIGENEDFSLKEGQTQQFEVSELYNKHD